MAICKHLPAGLFMLILALLAGSNPVSAQKKVEWIYSDYVEFDQANYGKVRRAIGSVQFKHEGTYLFCDSAYFYEESNIVEAYSNVHIQDSDTLNLFSDFLVYTPENRTAIARKNVVLVDPQVSLTTEELTYDLKSNTAHYTTGATIVSNTNTLTSTRGTYYADQKLFVFEKNVVLTHPRFTLYTDTLHYYTNTEVAHLYGPTLIRSDENLIYAERGRYDTRKDFSIFWQKAWLQNKESKLKGDSITYDRESSFARAFGHVVVIDTVSKYEIGGNYGEYDEVKGYSFMTEEAWANVFDATDTLSLSSDTIYVTFDSLNNGKIFNGYHGVRFYRRDVQGACDSLAYLFSDSTITMYRNPVIWINKAQVIADTIVMYIVDQKLDSMTMNGNAFIISDDLGDRFNQVKGKRILCQFKDRELNRMFVYGNTETLYYVRDESELLIGIDKARGEMLRMEFAEGEISLIVQLRNVEGTTYPEEELPEAERLLKGFLLRKGERPASRSELKKVQ